MISEASIQRALAAALYYHKAEVLRPAMVEIEANARDMFTQQAWAVITTLYETKLMEAKKEEDDDRTEAILLLMVLALKRRFPSDVTAMSPGMRMALAISVANTGLAKYGIRTGIDSVRGEKYLLEHGAELVSGINDMTREELRKVLARGFAAGATKQQIADDIVRTFSDMSYSRAYKIATTEVTKAWSYVEMTHAEEMERSGYKMVKEWIINPAHPRPDPCDWNVAAGIQPMSATFPSGAKAPPDHPHCGCSLVTFPDPRQHQPWGSLVLGAAPFAPFGGDLNQPGGVNA